MIALQGSQALPLLAIFRVDEPNRPFVLQVSYTQSTVLEKLRIAAGNKATSASAKVDLSEDDVEGKLP